MENKTQKILKKVKSTEFSNLIIEGIEHNSRTVRVEFYPAYEKNIHYKLSQKLKRILRKSKVEFFDIINEGFDIIDLMKTAKQRCVKSVTWENNKWVNTLTQ